MLSSFLKDGSTWRTNKFTDIASYPMPSACESRLWERRLFHCIPVCCLGLSISSCIREHSMSLLSPMFPFLMFF